MPTAVMSQNTSPLVSPSTTLPFSPTQPQSTPPSSGNTRTSMQPIQNHAGQQDFRRRSTLDRPSSYARDRMSAYSVKSNASSRPSRTASSVFPFATSPLPQIHVRDFAYAQNHPFHYGPPPDPSAPPSGQSTPALDASFSSPDYSNTIASSLRTNWSETSAAGPGLQLAAVAYGDMPEDEPDDHGPPYSEDEDLHSPVVISSHSRRAYDDERGYFAGVNGDGSENYYLSDPSEEAGGPGGVVETYPSEQARHGTHSRHISHTLDHSNTYYAADASFDGQNLAVGAYDPNSRRLSRDYSFTIASPDEEMHGTAVALYDFTPENDNELPLVEGQVIWVSYRNGQGWLVAEDPKTRETGLVPEEYVRLFRHIEHEGWQRLTGDDASDAADLLEGMALSPVAEQPDLAGDNVFLRKASLTSGQAIQSTFSTSSKDLEPFPHPLPTGGQAPPQIMHQRAESQSIAELLSPTSATSSMLSPKSLPTENKKTLTSHSRQSSEIDRRRSTDSTREKEKESVSRRGSKSSRRTSKGSKR